MRHGSPASAALTTQSTTSRLYSGSDPHTYVNRGSSQFFRGKVCTAVADYDKAITLGGSSTAGALWQRRLALYSAELQGKSAAQFKLDVAGSPNDTEESVWNFLTNARASWPKACASACAGLAACAPDCTRKTQTCTRAQSLAAGAKAVAAARKTILKVGPVHAPAAAAAPGAPAAADADDLAQLHQPVVRGER